ncbi:helix-turn-helix domain-containing protein [Chamaesiphon sp.]|uniref:helix-turn-helix domain-containing protein n=1 Tax=Chamaesiphon sp. TaxID=2814140 RepID=UPI003592FF32
MSNVTKGSDNVFKDLGFGDEEATNLKIRADLMINLQKFIKSQNWTQAEAANFFGETQPRISNLMNGDIDRFAIDKLVQMLSQAGMEVRIVVTSQVPV